MASSTQILLSQQSINEGEMPGGYRSNLSIVDKFSTDSFSFELVDGLGGDHNSFFDIEAAQLVNVISIDHEDISSLKLRLRASSSNGISFEQEIIVSVNNLHEPDVRAKYLSINFFPYGASLSSSFSNFFSDIYSTGLIARFVLDPFLANSINLVFDKLYPELPRQSWIDVLLYDQPGLGSPKTVSNFLSYINSSQYINTFFHRLIHGFILQGGGYIWSGDEYQSSSSISRVTLQKPLNNDFSISRSNIRGTLAMAKLASSPDSATSQWFFNLSDNSQNLDNQNGGFTVFGRVLSHVDQLLIDILSSLETVDTGGIFSSLPLYKLGITLDPTDILRLESISIYSKEPHDFEIIKTDGNLFLLTETDELIYPPTIALGDVPLNSFVDIRATNLLGESTDERFDVITNWNPDIDSDGIFSPLTDCLLMAKICQSNQSNFSQNQTLDNNKDNISLIPDIDGNKYGDIFDVKLLARFSFGTFPGSSLGVDVYPGILASDLDNNSFKRNVLILLPPLT